MKRNRQSIVRRARNRANKTRMKGAIKGVYSAMDSGSVEDVKAALQAAIPVIDRTAVKGTIHKKNASRRVSRLTKAVNTFLASAAQA